MRHSFKVMHDELYTVKVRISSGWARWVGEKIWHESQKAQKNGEGSLELTFQVAGLDEIKRWILSFGPDCQVLEPPKLKEMLRMDLNKCLTQYMVGRPSINLMRCGTIREYAKHSLALPKSERISDEPDVG